MPIGYLATVALPGAQHSFDVSYSIRFEAVIDAVVTFTGWVRDAPSRRDLVARHDTATSDRPARRPV